LSAGRQRLLNQCVAAFVIASLLVCARPLAYGSRVYFIVQVALVGGRPCHTPSAIWWEMPRPWILAEIAGPASAWTLAGLALAKLADPQNRH
jgi:hypothetical protein